ncbi:hypothetical protein [Dyadobacter sp. CY312]|uniref:hypothetical protein n=1 Tax=Dyadobacter sp. CY312 TaxID=2907303 RepID=UPI001F243E3F|nr:hypothetical protein [Dyadobacter sp. CY312]MCE7043358.1 hypothetical protein [Dyadobacter sp. CY312]
MKSHMLTSLLFLGLTCQAQLDTNREVQIGYSPWARERFVNDALRLLFFRTLNTTPSRKMDFSDSFSASYRYQLRSKFSIGLTGAVTAGEAYRQYLFESPSNYQDRSVLIAFETKFIYMNKSRLSMYSLAGLGSMLRYEKDLEKPETRPRTLLRPTGQITPFGIRYGKNTGAFAELGWGYKGILNLGVSAKF